MSVTRFFHVNVCLFSAVDVVDVVDLCEATYAAATTRMFVKETVNTKI